MVRAVPQVFTISPGTDFVACLVDALLDGRVLSQRYRDQPEALADLTIFVPTQRVRAELRDRLFAATAPHPVLLPHIRALGEPWDPLEQTLDSVLDESVGAVAQPLDPLRRRFLLLPLVSAWHRALHRPTGFADEPGGPDGPHAIRERLALADALGGLIDEMIIADLPLDLLARAAPPGYDPSRHDTYWEETRRFLQIAAEAWPLALAEEGLEDSKAMRRAALDEDARRIHHGAPGAFLVIGSTGSVPATARLMRAVSRHDNGAVVLPGLDLSLSDASWDLIGKETASLATRFAHAQSTLKATLGIMDIPRDAVRPLDIPAAWQQARNRLVSEALAPAEQVHAWREALAGIDRDQAMAGISVLEASDPRREALAIAVLIREALDVPGKRVALVTADRALGQRVKTELARWQIAIEDSSGLRLGTLQAGQLALLMLRAVEEPNGAHLLALLRHPDCRLGLSEARRADLVTQLEMAVLRRRRSAEPATLAQRIEEAIADPETGRSGIAVDRDALLGLAATLDEALGAIGPPESVLSLDTLLTGFLQGLDRLGRSAEGQPVWRQHPSGLQVVSVVEALRQAAPALSGPPVDLREILRAAIADTVIPAEGTHPRAAIFGPLEARLLATDRLILGGLNEGTFPPVAREDPFLNRTMRLHLGLTPPERRIGQSAHDFQMLAGNREIILSRAQQTGEGPAQPSRFWRRLEAICGRDAWNALCARGKAWLDLATTLDEVDTEPAPLMRPVPVPAAPRLPRKLSITEVEVLWRDPFALYARHILNLAVPDPIDPPFDARDRGNLVHRCLERFAAETPPADLAAATERLLAIGREEFAAFRGDLARHAFWWRPFEAMAPAFAAFDAARRQPGISVFTEQRARLPVSLPNGDAITLTGKADRLEFTADGAVAVLDYKTGAALPAKRDLAAGLAPQLPMTAALALRGAFGELPPASDIRELGYLHVGDHGEGTVEPIYKGEERARSQALWDQLILDLTELSDGRKGYASRLKPARGAEPGDFDHLARVREWDVLGGQAPGEDEEGDDG